jgi:hypothetical protein
MNHCFVKPPLLCLCCLKDIGILRRTTRSRNRNIDTLLIKIKLLSYSQEKDHRWEFYLWSFVYNLLCGLFSLGWRHLNEYVFSL